MGISRKNLVGTAAALMALAVGVAGCDSSTKTAAPAGGDKGGADQSASVASAAVPSPEQAGAPEARSDEENAGANAGEEAKAADEKAEEAPAAKTKPAISADGYVAIPAGEFRSPLMKPEAPSVAIKAFELAARPVTAAEYEQCVKDGKCDDGGKSIARYDKSSEGSGAGLCNYGRPDHGNHPMNCITWGAAAAYCRAMGGRLPSAAEWEYASTHDGEKQLNTKYPWGDDEPAHCKHAAYKREKESGTYYCNGRSRVFDKVGTSPVGAFSPMGDSPLGLQDMSGNVEEWVADLLGDGHRNAFGKGGYFSAGEKILAVADLSEVMKITDQYLSAGFRCARGGEPNASSEALDFTPPLLKGEGSAPSAKPLEAAYVSIPAGEYTYRKTGKTVPVKAFKLAKTPVTVEQYRQCVLAGACKAELHALGNARSKDDEDVAKFCNDGTKPGMPVNCVTYDAAAQYCAWAGGRLPSDEEWKYAATHDGEKARATDYPWGDEAFGKHCVAASYKQFNANGPNGSANYYCDGRNQVLAMVGTAPVGTYSPAGDSPLGLVDMSGNVWEWTSTVDGQGRHRLNGGSWDMNVIVMEVDGKLTKESAMPDNASNVNVGVRCARDE